ncbi:hypothetical protein IWZ03DRAFT_51683 [Phyllosticta citriasiana]|uniref:Uncharacterized protein n=1 Tax=Phyllosticta citriasiana TaxID=595635 RepID=A0ABR1KEF6_9PEZI
MGAHKYEEEQESRGAETTCVCRPVGPCSLACHRSARARRPALTARRERDDRSTSSCHLTRAVPPDSVSILPTLQWQWLQNGVFLPFSLCVSTLRTTSMTFSQHRSQLALLPSSVSAYGSKYLVSSAEDAERLSSSFWRRSGEPRENQIGIQKAQSRPSPPLSPCIPCSRFLFGFQAAGWPCMGPGLNIPPCRPKKQRLSIRPRTECVGKANCCMSLRISA